MFIIVSLESYSSLIKKTLTCDLQNLLVPYEETCDDGEKSTGHQLEQTVEPNIDFVQQIWIGEFRVPLKTGVLKALFKTFIRLRTIFRKYF